MVFQAPNIGPPALTRPPSVWAIGKILHLSLPMYTVVLSGHLTLDILLFFPVAAALLSDTTDTRQRPRIVAREIIALYETEPNFDLLAIYSVFSEYSSE